MPYAILFCRSPSEVNAFVIFRDLKRTRRTGGVNSATDARDVYFPATMVSSITSAVLSSNQFCRELFAHGGGLILISKGSANIPVILRAFFFQLEGGQLAIQQIWSSIAFKNHFSEILYS